MAVFQSRPYNPNAPGTKLNALFRRYPFLFGGPFIGIIVLASFGMTTFTQTRYDLAKQKTTVMSAEEEKRMEAKRRPIDKREEYFRLSAEASEKASDDWENVRVARPAGIPEWGMAPGGPERSPFRR